MCANDENAAACQQLYCRDILFLNLNSRPSQFEAKLFIRQDGVRFQNYPKV